jgi:DnaJ-class molecular chaperone
MVGKSHYRVRGVHCGKCEHVHTWYKYRVWREGKKIKEEYIGKCDQFGNRQFHYSYNHHKTEQTQPRVYRSPYEVLGIRYSATRGEIDRAYRLLVKQYHPDMNKAVDPRMIVEINVAYQILTK